MTDASDPAERIERRWATVTVGIIALLVVMAVYAGVHQAVMPQALVQVDRDRLWRMSEALAGVSFPVS